jgi:predicted dehydrogenase
MIRVGIIGCGYWGPNIVRNLTEVENATVVACCDLSSERLSKVQKRYPGVRCTQDRNDLLRDTSIDAIVVATPISTHYAIGREALEQGKHVWVEKPLASTSEQALKLVELAARLGKVLMVDHTFVYTSAVRRIRQLIDAGELGDILYFDSVRVNLGLFQNDTNVIWDLAPHDLSIMDFLLRRKPESVIAVGACHTVNRVANMAYLTLSFPDNLLAHVHVNWLAPVKIRLTMIGGTQKMIVYDDLEPSEKVRVYDKGVVLNHSPENRYQALVGYRVGDVLIPKLEITEALRTAGEEFVGAIMEGRAPLTDGEAGYRLVRLLEAAQASLELGGRPVELKSWSGSPIKV